MRRGPLAGSRASRRAEIQALLQAEVGQEMLSLRTLLRAARGLADHALPPAAAYGIWSALNRAFVDALGGLDAADAHGRRESYRRALREPVRPRRPAMSQRSSWSARIRAHTLSSCRSSRSWRKAALPPSCDRCADGHDDARPAQARLAGARFPVRTLEVAEEDSIASALDSAVAQATATFVVALDPPNAFDPARSSSCWSMASPSAGRHGDSPTASRSRPAPSVPTRSRRVSPTVTQNGRRSRVRTAPAWRSSVRRSPRPASARSRSPAPCTPKWADFVHCRDTRCGTSRCVDMGGRANVCGNATYLHAVTDHAHELSVAQRDSAQRAIFGDYYARACDPAAASPNPFAPSLANWG